MCPKPKLYLKMRVLVRSPSPVVQLRSFIYVVMATCNDQHSRCIVQSRDFSAADRKCDANTAIIHCIDSNVLTSLCCVSIRPRSHGLLSLLLFPLKIATMRDTMKIFVGNVDDRTTQQELSELFEKYGTVVSCAVMKQYAFVHMRVSDRATKAIEELNGREIHGKKMVVELSKPRPQNTWKIFVGNVGTDCDAADLRSTFETYGKVIECDVVKGNNGGGSAADKTRKEAS